MSSEPSILAARCDAMFRGGGQAIDWIGEVRGNSKRLDRDSDSLIGGLRRVRNLSKRLGRAVQRPLSVGFFGLSQAGKSYLISALAADAQGQLETLLEGERLNFISHVNPPGGGKEATGLVTRFTRRRSAAAAPPGFPIHLTLFSEADLIKVLGNAFFNDFDRERVTQNTEADYIRELLGPLEKRRQPEPTGGLTEDDGVDLLDYFEKRYRKSMAPLIGDYWPSVITLAPYLRPADRATLFSVLWGENRALTDTYLRLRNALAKLDHAEALYCPLTALVERTESGDWTQADSIMNVDILERLGRDDQDGVEVRPLVDGQLQPLAQVARSLLAALTAELRLALAEQPAAGLLEEVDLLDFPGYRGRLSIADLDDVRKQLKDEQVDPVAQLVLRGKVAYLFERYTEDQEMNVLVFCTPCDSQIDVNSLGPVLEAWINATQGGDPGQRAQHVPGLFWAVTKFDRRLEPRPGETEDLMRIGWDGMMKQTLLDRFGQYDWVREWTPGRAFDNLYLVRKPTMATDVIETQGGREIRILPAQAPRLQRLRGTFLEDKTVRRYVNEPQAAWDAMVGFNDGGIERLVLHLEQAARPEVKLERIREQLDATARDLVEHRFGPYYQREGAAQVEQKQRIAEEIVAALGQQADRFGELLYALQPSPEHLRSLYLRAEEEEVTTEEATAAAGEAGRGGGGLIDLGAFATPSAAPQAGDDVSSSANRFAQATLRDWIAQLRQLAEDTDLVRFLGVPKPTLEALTDELITAADRLGLEGHVVGAIGEAEERAAARRTRLVERQVLAVRTVLNEFIDSLGMDLLRPAERPRSPVAPQRMVFELRPDIPAGELPDLPAQPINFSAAYILDWFEALKKLTLDNAGHAAGRDITPEQNQRLGEILGLIAG